MLVAFVIYASWSALQHANYYAAPYLSPFYSPCLSVNCEHVTIPLVGSWWNLSPAFLILWIPLGFRATCYYYRQAYYRAILLSPAACAVRDVGTSYKGESAYPLLLQNSHRYFFYLSVLVLAFLWWDVFLAFRFQDGFGVGVGTLVLGVNAVLLSLYSLSCNSCRHICGGHVKSLRRAPYKHKAWHFLSGLNEKHRQYAWLSLGSVCLADLYVRLLAEGVIRDLRLF